MVGPQPSQLGLAGGDLLVEVLDETQARRRGGEPGLRQIEASEELLSAHAEEVGDRTRESMRNQGGVDAVLEGRAVTHQVEAETGPLALGAHLGGR